MFSARRDEAVVDTLREASLPLGGLDSLDPLIERIGDARIVLLGEATHGTHEFYAWRHLISQRLVDEKGFDFIAVEGDWPDCRQVDRFVKGQTPHADAHDVLHAFERWPTWMWGNREVLALAEWLHGLNEGRTPERKVGFYGLDVYSLWDSLKVVIGYLDRVDPDAASVARKAWACFEPFGEDAQDYARSTRIAPESCEDDVVELLIQMKGRTTLPERDDEAFDAEQNALVAANAESYYRAMVRGGPESWNVRDRHMVETLGRLLDHHGSRSKAIVWEHNTHVGDARATDMARGGMVNVGQLCRERWGDDETFIAGFSTYGGTVIAGQSWDAPMERMRVPPAPRGTWEALLHEAAPRDQMLLMDEAPEDWNQARGHRAIGVVYHPEADSYGNYVPTVLPRRYDALLHVDRSQALHPLRLPAHLAREPPETWPTGF